MTNLEVLATVRLRSRRTGEVRTLTPGPIRLPDEQAAALLTHAPTAVRLVPDAAPVVVGCRVQWDSPLFGLLEAVALAVSEKQVRLLHPLTGVEASIPRAWCRVIA